MAINPGVVGLTRTELEEARKQRAMQAAQISSAAANAIANRKEQARQYDITTGLPAAMGGNQTLYELLQTEEGRAAAAPFVQKLTGIRDPRKLNDYMMAVALSPQDAATLQRAGESAFLGGRTVQDAGAPQAPNYMDLAKTAAMRYRPDAQGGGAVVGAGGAPTPSSPSGDRTLAPAQRPDRAVYGSELSQPMEGQVSGAGYKAVFVPAMNGYVLVDSMNRRVTPNRIPGAFATPEEAFQNLDAALTTNTASIEGETPLDIGAGAKVVEHPATSVLQMTADQLRATIADSQSSGIVKDAAASRLRQMEAGSTPPSAKASIVTSDYPAESGAVKTTPSAIAAAPAEAAPLKKDMSFREYLIAKQKAGALGGSPVNPQGTDDAALVANNTGSYQEWERFRRGESPTWASGTPASSAGSTVASTVSKAAEGSAQLSADDKLIAAYYYTKRAQQYGDSTGLQRAGLTALSGAEMARAERILASQAGKEATDVVRTWRASPKLGKADAQLAAQHAQTLQIVGGNLPAQLNPMLTQVMTNWADIDRRTKEATIAQLESAAGLNKAQAQYYLDRLRFEAAGDTMDYMARMDEGSKKLLTGVIDMFNGVYKEPIQTIYKIGDPEKRTKEMAKLVDSDPMLKSAFTAYQRSISWMLNTPITPEFTTYLYGGFLGLGQKQGSTMLGSVDLGAGASAGLGTDAAGEAAGYSLE